MLWCAVPKDMVTDVHMSVGRSQDSCDKSVQDPQTQMCVSRLMMPAVQELSSRCVEMVLLLLHMMHASDTVCIVTGRYDDDLARLQQIECQTLRQDLSADFINLKIKGHKHLYRGSSLKFLHADKMCAC